MSVRPAAFLGLVAASLAAAALVGVADDAPSSVKEAPRSLDPRACGVGGLVEDVAFTDADGTPGRLSDFRGKSLVVALTTAGCPIC